MNSTKSASTFSAWSRFKPRGLAKVMNSSYSFTYIFSVASPTARRSNKLRLSGPWPAISRSTYFFLLYFDVLVFCYSVMYIKKVR